MLLLLKTLKVYQFPKYLWIFFKLAWFPIKICKIFSVKKKELSKRGVTIEHVAMDSAYKFGELTVVTAYFVDKKYATLKAITKIKIKHFLQNIFRSHWLFIQMFAFWSKIGY